MKQSKRTKRPTKRRAATRKPEPNVPMAFPCAFWERVLSFRTRKPATWAVFSPGFKLSATIYEEQRDRRRASAHATARKAA